MLSALFTDPERLQFGHAPLEEQPERLQATAPLPAADGTLHVDPGFTLPTAAGPVRWQLFYSSRRAGYDEGWGYGWRAS